MDVREVGGDFVALDGDRALAFTGDAAAAYRAGGISRRNLLKAVGAGAAIAGVAAVAAPPAWAANSHAHFSITPATGPRGTVVSLSGGGYTPNSLIQVTVAGVSATLSPAAVTTDSSGNIPAGVTFRIPSTAPVAADQVAVIVNGFSDTSGGNFTVTAPTASISDITPKKAGARTENVTGTGWVPGSTVTVSVTGTGYSISGGNTFTANATTGAISGSFTLNTPGSQGVAGTVTFSDTFGNSVSIPVTTSP